jgi:SAM-dependent methyltransferase
MTSQSAQSWQPLWNDIFASRSWGAYPSENLIRFIARNYYQVADRSKIKILDLGAGAGANTRYLSREGFDTYAIDGSAVAIEIIRKSMESENLPVSLAVGDVGDIPFEDGYFDCIVDINCVMCNTYDVSKNILAHVAKKLKPGGRVFSMGAKQGSWGEGLGRKLSEDTYEDATEGPYANMGIVRYLRAEQIEDLFSPFTSIEVNSCGLTRNNGKDEITFWLIDGIKK